MSITIFYIFSGGSSCPYDVCFRSRALVCVSTNVHFLSAFDLSKWQLHIVT
jgi:hypothetical protein